MSCINNIRNECDDNSLTAENVGIGRDILVEPIVNDNLQFRRLDQGANVSIAESGPSLIISAVDTVSTGTNLGTGELVYINSSAPNFQFKSIASNDLNTFVTSTADEVRIGITAANSVGTGESLVANAFNQIKSITAGSNIILTSNASEVQISASGSGGGITELIDSGAGSSLIAANPTGPITTLRRIEAGQGLTLTFLSDRLRLQSTNFLNSSFSAKKNNITLIGPTPVNIGGFNLTGYPGTNTGGVGVFNGTTFRANAQGMYLATATIQYSAPAPISGQVIATIRTSADTNSCPVRSESSTDISSGSLTLTRMLFLFSGQQVTIEVSSTVSSPQVDAGSVFSVLRTY